MVWMPDNLFISIFGTIGIWLLIGLWIYISKKMKQKNDK